LKLEQDKIKPQNLDHQKVEDLNYRNKTLNEEIKKYKKEELTWLNDTIKNCKDSEEKLHAETNRLKKGAKKNNWEQEKE